MKIRNKCMLPLIYFAKDTHKLIFNKTSSIFLGGYKFKSNYSILAHSDGDLILHAISSVILASLNMGSLGEYFSDKDIINKNISSVKIIDFCLKKMLQKKIQISNIDITLVCDKIMFSNKTKKITNSLAKILKIKKNKISIKSTRFENNSNFIECNCIGAFYE